MGRPHLEHLHTPEVPWVPLAWPGWPPGARVKALSQDAESGAVSALVELPAGYALPAGCHATERELLVLEGALRVGAVERGSLYWDLAPAGAPLEPVEALAPTTLLFFARTGPPAFVPAPAPGPAATPAVDPPGRLRVAAGSLPWTGNPIDDGPPAVRVKVLRLHPETGELAALVEDSVEPYSVYEFHDCVEEVFLISGDLTLGNSGEMLPGSYFWRPPYITHGMSTSRGGSFYYVYCDSELINHRTDAMTRTAAENRAQVARNAASASR